MRVDEAEAGRSADGDELAAMVRGQTAIMRDQVAYYLDRARAAARVSVIGAATEVDASVEALLRTFQKLYVDRGLTFTKDIPPDLRFRGERQDFDDLVGNLIDNAGKWAAATVRVQSRLVAGEADGTQQMILTVDDDGPGLKAEARAFATRRGRRLDESKPGSGLGLSIVTDLASAYGGELMLHDSPLGGLRAELRLPGTSTEFRLNSM